MNNRISKWFLTLLLAAVFALCLPLGVLAEKTNIFEANYSKDKPELITSQAGESFTLEVSGVELYYKGTATGKTVDGATYDPASNTLTLIRATSTTSLKNK